MAKQINLLIHLTISTLFILLITISQARPLTTNADLFATSDLALPGATPEKSSGSDQHVQPPCEMADGSTNSAYTNFNLNDQIQAAKNFAGNNYQTLFLSALPKGTVPPSGPSKRTNSINN